MTFRKPFQAVPIKMGERYRRKRVQQKQMEALRFVGLAAITGAAFGLASVVLTPAIAENANGKVQSLVVSLGLARARVPQKGDYWYRCDQARAAGSAPIYDGEPGYREGLDGDNDGIACEPYPGMR